MLSASGDKKLKFWRTVPLIGGVTHSQVGLKLKYVASSKTAFSHSVSCVEFSPDSMLIAAGSKDKTIKIWDQSCME